MGRPRILHVNPGDKFGRLTIIKEIDGTRYSRRILCKCDCGKNKVVDLTALISGNTQSCGCLKKELVRAKNLTHGLSGSKLHHIWTSMKQRCFNPNDQSYFNYGARGIRVSQEWLDFQEFYKWAMSNGYREGLTIERTDNDGNYEPSNCKIIPFSEQSKNRRSNHWIEFSGERKTMSQWARDLGFKRETIKDRIRSGWPIEKVLTTPIKSKEAV